MTVCDETKEKRVERHAATVRWFCDRCIFVATDSRVEEGQGKVLLDTASHNVSLGVASKRGSRWR